MPEKVIILGGSGMLGSMMADYLSRDPALEVAATVRTEALAARCQKRLPDVNWVLFNAGTSDLQGVLGTVGRCEWLINAIGITKPLIHDDNALEIEQALLINSLLPHQIAQQTQAVGAKVLQIATDCVYSGSKGEYEEDDGHDALDVYGKTKSLGEVPRPHFHHLRCSIIGPEPKEHKFLLDWFLDQPSDSNVKGYVNHRWNGVTTLHFAKLCHGIITQGIILPHLQHLVPGGGVTKYELLQSFAQNFYREDVTIAPVEAGVVVNRTLRTNNKPLNLSLWAAAGYSQPPSILQMVADLAHFDYRFANFD